MSTAQDRVAPVDVSLLLIRVMIGVVFMFHGSQKLFGMFEGPGMEGFTQGLTSMGIPMPALNAYLAAGAEFFGGLLLAVGLLTRLAAIPVVVTMMVAAFMVHGSAFSLQHSGMEYALTLGVVTAAVGIAGAGKLSIDALIGRSLGHRTHAATEPATA
jgi:putative oxidoreductase